MAEEAVDAIKEFRKRIRTLLAFPKHPRMYIEMLDGDVLLVYDYPEAALPKVRILPKKEAKEEITTTLKELFG